MIRVFISHIHKTLLKAYSITYVLFFLYRFICQKEEQIDNVIQIKKHDRIYALMM